MTDFNNLLNQLFQREVQRIVSVNLGKIVGEAAQFATGDLAISMEKFSKTYSLLLKTRKGEFANANRNSAIRAQRSIIAKYRAETADSPPSYRQGDDRFSGGLLEEALGSPQFFDTSDRHVYFINEDLLDRQAAHWYRLNFGAGSGETSTVEVPVAFFGVASGLSFGWTNRRASAAFNIPAGGWNQQGQFYPGPGGDGLKFSRSRIARPITARSFLEPGIRTLAEEVPKNITKVVSDIITESQNAGGAYWSSRKFRT